MSKWIADDVVIKGDVQIGDLCSVYYHSVIRTESEKIVIKEGTNIQDACILHVDEGYPMTIGKDTTVGHGCILHGCQIGDECLIGMGSIIMNGACIEDHCIIGAGSLITEHTHIPSGSMAFGRPCKVVRTLSEEEKAGIVEAALHYQTYIKGE